MYPYKTVHVHVSMKLYRIHVHVFTKLICNHHSISIVICWVLSIFQGTGIVESVFTIVSSHVLLHAKWRLKYTNECCLVCEDVWSQWCRIGQQMTCEDDTRWIFSFMVIRFPDHNSSDSKYWYHLNTGVVHEYVYIYSWPKGFPTKWTKKLGQY